MSTREQLNSYIEQLERRLRLGTTLRGAAILLSSALITTVVLVVIINSFAFSKGSVTGARVALLLALVIAVSFGLGIPLSRLNRRKAVGKAENFFPQFQQRLVTFAERDQDGREPFLDLLAADTLQAARDAEPALLVPDKRLLVSAGAGAASLGVLLWMIMAGPGFLGYGAALLWAGPHVSATPFYDIRVTPGDVTVRRHADQLVTALPVGVQTDNVRLYARYQNTSKWESLAMQPQPGASAFQFLFGGVPDDVEYYIQAGAVRSRHFNIHVVDMPSVKQIRVTYRFPSWAGMQPRTDEQSGDLRALQGTYADLEIQMDRPLRDGMLALDNGQQISLSGGANNLYKGTIRMDADGIYHVAALDQGQPVRLSGDYFIEANQPQPAQVQIVRPGGDYRASPIEEVTVAVKAADDFGLNGLDLHYSVNGGPDQTVNLLKQKGVKQADGSTVLSLENFKLVPGDIVSLYATAKDARSDARTDIFFVQADPFEREFSQSQQAGGGGGGGGGGGQGNQDNISQREKEIIASTWKQQGDKTTTAQQAAESSKFLSEVQSKLADQAKSLASRMQSRELSQENEDFNSFVADMNSAAQAMGPAADKLKQRKWNDAMPNEQKALQYLLRAEATFRQIEVAFGSRGGSGGGGGGAGAGRDLASLFDLELDTEKNQYETADTAGSASQRDQQVDDALKKLDELARRQQDLANQQRDSAQNFQQRWQQEMLRRQAEELQRQMEQLAQANQQGSQSDQEQSGQAGQSAQQGQSGQSGQSSNGQQQSSSSAPRAKQALDRLQQATNDMQRAASSSGQEQSQADARRAAADHLREAMSALGGVQQQQSAGRLDSMAREADRLANEQQLQAGRARSLFGQQGANGFPSGQSDQTVQQLGQLAQDRQKLSDDLSRLRKQMQDSERELVSNQHSSATKLRDALGGMEQNDLPNLVQRSADWLRRGIDPNSNSTESGIASGLQQLSQQMHAAQQAGDSGQQQGTETALDRVERLREQMQVSGANGRNARGGQQGQQGQAQQGQGQQGQQAQRGQAGQQGRGGQGGQLSADALGRNGDARGGYDNRDGDTRGGGNRGGLVYGNIDTGDNSKLSQPAIPNTSLAPGDSEAMIQQQLSELDQIRQAVQDNPDTLRQVQDLIREMQRLDPSRFPSNPAVIEQLHAQVLNDVDKLDLQLRRTQTDKPSGQVRGAVSDTVPPGYQDAVAEYFRQLSKRQ